MPLRQIEGRFIQTDHKHVGGGRKYTRGRSKGQSQLVMTTTDSTGVIRVNGVERETQANTEYMWKQQVKQQLGIHLQTDSGGAFNRFLKMQLVAVHLRVNHSGMINPKNGVIHFYVHPVTGASNNRAEGINGIIARHIGINGQQNTDPTRLLRFITNCESKHNRTNLVPPQLFIHALTVLSEVYPTEGEPLKMLSR